MPKRKSIPTIEQLKEAARAENWDYVDHELRAAAQREEYVSWAVANGIKDTNVNVRDLGASLIEQARLPAARFDPMKLPLARVMQRDRNNYAGFRAACALAAHDPGSYREEVVETLRRFSEDKDVKPIASKYLKKLKVS